jgi:trehalose 6-phosphate synthase
MPGTRSSNPSSCPPIDPMHGCRADAGAAIELKDALLVNPHDTDGVKNALQTALNMNPIEAQGRMRAMRRQVLSHDMDRWARNFLDALGLPAAAG